MAKFTLIQNPTFRAKVAIPRVGAQPESVEFEFQYRDRTALAALYAGWSERHKELGLKVDAMGLEQFTAAQIDLQVDQVKAVVVGWDIEEEFTEKNIRILVSSIASAAGAVLAAYSEAYNQARLGNS